MLPYAYASGYREGDRVSVTFQGRPTGRNGVVVAPPGRRPCGQLPPTRAHRVAVQFDQAEDTGVIWVNAEQLSFIDPVSPADPPEPLTVEQAQHLGFRVEMDRHPYVALVPVSETIQRDGKPYTVHGYREVELQTPPKTWPEPPHGMVYVLLQRRDVEEYSRAGGDYRMSISAQQRARLGRAARKALR
jgi:hypothetical protein